MSKKGKKTVFVAMSGGVDSSVAAVLLKRKGYDVVGVFMRCFNVDGCAERDAEDARRVAERIGIPFYTWDFEEEYKKRVVEYIVKGYRAGITPNPDVMCNREIKFGLFLERALRAGADYVATGHYVRLFDRKNFTSRNPASSRQRGTRLSSRLAPTAVGDRASPLRGVSRDKIYSLHQAKDLNKDQSYFLWTLTQKDMKHCLFPVGEYLKPDVRKMARKAGLPTAGKKDSQGICFLGKVTLANFLKRYIPEKRGSVMNVTGEKIGEHRGVYFYTIGQRQGIGNLKHAKGTKLHKPLYIAEKDAKTNTIIVAEGPEHEALFRREVRLHDVSFISPNHSLIRENKRISVMARVRYRQPVFGAVLSRSGKQYVLTFDHPQKFIAPGQSAVFYRRSGPASAPASPRLRWASKATAGMEMLGGGVIV